MYSVCINNVSKKFLKTNGRNSALSYLTGCEHSYETEKFIWALKNINIKFERGRIYGIIGPNGAGKSTLLSIIGGIFVPDEGSVSVNGTAIPVIGLANALKDQLSVHDNIYLCAALFGIPSQTIREREKTILYNAQLESHKHAKIYQLSTGMLARLIFSISIHADPDVLLLDEVTSNLDVSYSKKVSTTIRKMTEKGLTAIVVSHKEWVIKQCDTVLWLDNGEIVMEGSSKKIASRYFKK